MLLGCSFWLIKHAELFFLQSMILSTELCIIIWLPVWGKGDFSSIVSTRLSAHINIIININIWYVESPGPHYATEYVEKSKQWVEESTTSQSIGQHSVLVGNGFQPNQGTTYCTLIFRWADKQLQHTIVMSPY